jgi:hypothetical protein
MQWSNEKVLPKEIRAAMVDMLAEALREAAHTEDPGDGCLIRLSPERIIGKGMWDGGWKLQSSFIEDSRMNAMPFVRVYAYQGSQLAKACVSADVVRTAQERHYLKHQRLISMIQRRDSLNAAIDKLTVELEAEHTD